MSENETSARSTGYRRPPTATRFRKGQSGNPGGRPRGRSSLPFDSVLGQIVTVRENGGERRLTAEAAFLEFLTRRGLEGDGPAGRATMESIKRVRDAGGGLQKARIEIVTMPPMLYFTLLLLDMADYVDPHRPTAHFLFRPWLIQAALDRLGDKRLSLEEQKLVLKATRTPRRVRWPDWWEAEPN